MKVYRTELERDHLLEFELERLTTSMGSALGLVNQLLHFQSDPAF